MSMRWMKLEAQPSVPSLYFLLFSWNKVKIAFFYLFSDLSVQYKNTPKIKVLQMPWNWNMFFSGIFENIWHWEHNRGSWHLATRVQGAPTLIGHAPTSWAHGGTLHLFLHPYTTSSSHKHQYPAQARVLAHFAAIFDLLAQSTSHKTALGDCSLVCDSSIGPISFCSSALLIANLWCLGDHVLELAYQIYMVPSSSNAWYRP